MVESNVKRVSLNNDKNPFKRFNWYPFQHQCQHAVDLLKLYTKDDQSRHYQASHEVVSQPPDDFECNQLAERLDRIWQEQIKKKGADKASLTYALWRCLASDFLICIGWTIFVRVFLLLILLETTRRILLTVALFDPNIYTLSLTELDIAELEIKNDTKHLVKSDLNTSQISGDLVELIDEQHSIDRLTPLEDRMREVYYEIIVLAAWFVLILAAFLVLQSNIKLELAKCGLKCRIVMSQLIFKKSMKLHLFKNAKQSSNQAMSLISNEVTFIDEANKFVAYIVTGPTLLFSISAWLALTEVGWIPVVLTLPFLAVFILIQMYLPKYHKKASELKKIQTNKRIDITGSFLNSIKIVKMYAWESKFKEKIEEFRRIEMDQMKHLDRYTLFDITSMSFGSKVLPGIIFLSCILLYNELDITILFIAPIAYSLSRGEVFYYFPRSLKSFSDIKNACKNIKQYLLTEEIQDDRIWKCPENYQYKPIMINCKNVIVSIKSLPGKSLTRTKSEKNVLSKFFVGSNRIIIEGLDMSLEKGDLVIVMGQVGTGKTTLLLTLLGETCITSGTLTITSGTRFAYASQEPCLFSDSLKNNIINGRPMDLDRYNKVIEVCSMARDIKMLPEADETLVGSKGVSLSGGQKARLSLARAIYSEADVYLLDDPLSALDSKVANHIFNKCIREFLADKVVVLATHQVQFIHSTSKVVLLKRDAKPIFGATRDILLQEEFRDLVAQIGESTQSADTTETRLTDSNIAKSNEKPNEKKSCRSNAHKSVNSQHGSIYMFYLKLGHGNFGLILLLLNSIIFIALTLYSDYYFRIWAMKVLEVQAVENSFEDVKYFDYLMHYWFIYFFIIVGFSISSILFNWHLTIGLRKASKKLHSMFMDSLFRAKMIFYDFCEIGELSSRFGNDFAIIDHVFIVNALLFAFCIILIFATIIPIAIINHIQLVPYLILFVICCPIATKSCGRLKTLLELNTAFRSPVYTNLSSTIDSLSTIRSDPDYINWIERRFELSQNKLTSMTLLTLIYDCSMKNNIKMITMSALAAMFYIIFGYYWTSLDVSTVGTFLLLSIGAASVFPALLEYGSIVESYMVSVDNVRKYTNLESEIERENEKIGEITEQRKWPEGKIVFNKVTMRYFEDERPAVDMLSFTINGGERIGVVGRTGAGKSSIISVIYRLYPFDGTISIDGIDTKSLTLADLRSSLSVIPQDPVLFHDSLRRNLDPFGLYEDVDLWRSLDVVNLSNYVKHTLAPACLDYVISEGGRNFSAGQRQLVCLARAILKSTKVLLIDEATANVDTQTDAFIQETIRTQFKQSTIITVAHRLETILDYDRVLVLDAGKVVEFDKVERLLELENGVFKSMLQSSNIKV